MNKNIDEDNILPCYFFHGEETFLAHQFIRELREAFASPDAQEFNIEKFNLEDSSWGEIIDSARTIPFFFSPWRIISVDILEGIKEKLFPKEEEILKDYLSSPPAKTSLVIICWGRIRKNLRLFKFFSSFPPSLVFVRELKPLKNKALYSWMNKKLSSEGKRATMEAKERLVEIKGADLRSLGNELDKLITYVDEKEEIELDDVNKASGWAKAFVEWELSNSLEKGDYKQSIVVLNNLFKDGVRAERILAIIANFFRDIFLAKLWIREKKKDRKAIFRELRPHIQEKFGVFYSDKFREFFSLEESIPQNVLKHILEELKRIDLKIKTTGVSGQTLLENFLFDFCSFRKEGKLTWKERY